MTMSMSGEDIIMEGNLLRFSQRQACDQLLYRLRACHPEKNSLEAQEFPLKKKVFA